MRYLKVAVLLALIALAAALLEAAPAASGTALAFIKKSNIGVYLAVLLILGPCIALTSLGSFRNLFWLYYAQMKVSAAGFLAMFGFGLAMVLILLGLFALAGRVAWEGGPVGGHLSIALLTAAAAVLVACAVSVAEEALFRGFLVSYLRWNTSAAVTIGAVVTSALIFAVAHDLEDPLTWFTVKDFPLFVGLFLLGVLLAVTYIVTRSLWCPIGLHAALVAFDLAALQGDLIDLDLSPWWLGATNDVREAPALWAAFVAASCAMLLGRQWLSRNFAVEQPFVGAPLAAPAPAGFVEQRL